MTRSEFDAQVLAMKQEGAKRIAAMKEAVDGIDMQIATVNETIERARLYIKTLTVQKKALNTRIDVMKREFKEKRDAFVKEHLDSTTSNLAEANTLNIVYELRRRGFGGIIQNGENGEAYDLDKHDWKQDEDE